MCVHTSPNEYVNVRVPISIKFPVTEIKHSYSVHNTVICNISLHSYTTFFFIVAVENFPKKKLLQKE